MSNEQILFKTCAFFASDKWWKPIISFVYSNNDVFKSDDQSSLDKSKQSFTHQQYEKFMAFSNMIINMIDKTLCSNLGITDKMLENILISTYEEGNIQSRVIIETLQKTMNFFDFKNEMINCNVRTEELINEAIIEITSSLFNEADLNDPEKLANKVTEISQAKIDHEIQLLVEKGCRQMHGLLDIDITKINLPGSPQRRPLPNKTSPPRGSIHNSNSFPTNNSFSGDSDKLTTNAHLDSNSDNVEPKVTPKRHISRPPPLRSKIHLSRLSLNSSSSSNDDNNDDYYSSASLSPPMSPIHENSTKSAPQSPFSSSKTKVSPRTSPKLPSTSNSAVNSPTRPSKNLVQPHKSDDQQLDPEDIERRRQFYIKQRDILANKEHRKPPPHAIVRPHKLPNRNAHNTSPAKLRKYYRKIDE